MKIKVISSQCNGCTLCIKKCPIQSIRLENKTAVILDSCNYCGICISVCPQKAIIKSLEDEVIAPVTNKSWVMMETKLNGEIDSTSYEMISKLRELNPTAHITAVLLSSTCKNIDTTLLGSVGADEVFLLQNPAFEEYNAVLFTKALVPYCQREEPAVFVFPATEMGRDLAPRIATELHTGLTADCTDLSIDPENGLLIQTRPAWDGNLMASIICPNRRPQMATIRPHVFPMNQDKDRSCTTRIEEYKNPDLPVEKITQRSVIESTFPDLEKQTIVIGVGRGIGSKDNVDLIWDFAQSIHAGIGCSRPLVDNGWLPHEVQVGMSGKAIAPKVYIALGISGSVQHLVGMQSSEYIIAVNKDENAPIFHHAHLSLVGDIKKMLPLLKDIVEKRKKLS
ncbi:MAG: electron transfer flavoprotein subunit alpha [Caldisericia bacterium]|nr:electron transfer flavoprotein subunit alpha [Caldisericia bacterium]